MPIYLRYTMYTKVMEDAGCFISMYEASSFMIYNYLDLTLHLISKSLILPLSRLIYKRKKYEILLEKKKSIQRETHARSTNYPHFTDLDLRINYVMYIIYMCLYQYSARLKRGTCLREKYIVLNHCPTI